MLSPREQKWSVPRLSPRLSPAERRRAACKATGSLPAISIASFSRHLSYGHFAHLLTHILALLIS
jgi:hypothetical protein